MANDPKNRTKRERTDVSPKSKIARKELKKRVKVNKSFIKDSIAMSQQLKRKTAQHNEIYKLCTIVKPMPSLKDLEKMYDDSDEEDNVVAVRSPTELHSKTPELCANANNDLLECTIQENISNLNENSLSLTNSIDIDTLNDLPDVLSSTEPSPKKRTSCIIIQEYPKNEQTKSCLKETLDTPGSKNTTKLTSMDDNIDCNSSDSNKTVDYNLSTSFTFCPLPSTSNDKNTMIKNDKLFYESLKNASLFYSDGKINNSILEQKSKSNLNDKNNIDVDDDCIIINDCTDSTKAEHNNDVKKKNKVTETINLDDSLNTEKSVVALDEPIDIDALIADNRSMLTKYQNSQTIRDPNNSIIDVSLDSQQSNCTEQNQRHIPTSSNKVLNNQNNSQEVLFVSETLPNKPRKVDNMHSFYQQKPIYGPDGVQIDTQNQAEYAKYVLDRVQGFLNNYKQGMRETDNTSLNFFNSSPNSTPAVRRSSPIPPEISSNIIELSDTSPTFTNVQESVRNNKRKRKKPKSTETLTSNSVSSCTPSPTRNLGDCPICMDTFSGKILASTICGHVFCMPCLEMSVRSNRRCPTCRKILKNKTSYHQIFL